MINAVNLRSLVYMAWLSLCLNPALTFSPCLLTKLIGILLEGKGSSFLCGVANIANHLQLAVFFDHRLRAGLFLAPLGPEA